jgi:hypothetical protein
MLQRVPFGVGSDLTKQSLKEAEDILAKQVIGMYREYRTHMNNTALRRARQSDVLHRHASDLCYTEVHGKRRAQLVRNLIP